MPLRWAERLSWGTAQWIRWGWCLGAFVCLLADCGGKMYVDFSRAPTFCILTNESPQDHTRAASFDRAGELGEGVVGQVALVLGALLCPWCAAWAAWLDSRFQPCPCAVCLQATPPRRTPIVWLRWAGRASEGEHRSSGEAFAAPSALVHGIAFFAPTHGALESFSDILALSQES